jgi:uncharacterized iron-regulated protein
MGWTIAKHLKANPGAKIMQVNGGFHSEDQLGAAAQLKKYAPGTRIINVAAFAVENFNQADLSRYSKANTYIIITDGSLRKSY